MCFHRHENGIGFMMGIVLAELWRIMCSAPKPNNMGVRLHGRNKSQPNKKPPIN